MAGRPWSGGRGSAGKLICSIDKTTRLLGFRPSYSALDAPAEAVNALLDERRLVARTV
jgi:hypothetical protein